MTTEHTISYLQQKLEDLPAQKEKTEQILGRVTLNYYGQMALFEEQGEVISFPVRKGAA